MNKLDYLFNDIWLKIIAYLPNLLAGVLLLAFGWIIAWFLKRLTIQLLVILRFDKLFSRIKWKNALSKADIRYALYNLIGNIVFFIIFLVFLNSALDAFNLLILSKLIAGGVVFIPRLIVAILIFLSGWLIASRTAAAVLYSLIKENVGNSSLIARGIKFIVIFFFSAMALVELNIATEIVIIGFSTIIITLCIASLIILNASKNSFNGFFNSKQL